MQILMLLSLQGCAKLQQEIFLYFLIIFGSNIRRTIVIKMDIKEMKHFKYMKGFTEFPGIEFIFLNIHQLIYLFWENSNSLSVSNFQREFSLNLQLFVCRILYLYKEKKSIINFRRLKIPFWIKHQYSFSSPDLLIHKTVVTAPNQTKLKKSLEHTLRHLE